jgi:hypothetical protein
VVKRAKLTNSAIEKFVCREGRDQDALYCFSRPPNAVYGLSAYIHPRSSCGRVEPGSLHRLCGAFSL